MVRLNANKIADFLLGGNSTVTLESANTAKHFTYKVTQSKDKPELYFVKLLHGPDNENDYRYLGCYYKDTEYFHPCKTYQQIPHRNWPVSMQAISYLFGHLHNVPDNLYVYHEGRCARCGRRLTTPDSIRSGFGPECIKLT